MGKKKQNKAKLKPNKARKGRCCDRCHCRDEKLKHENGSTGFVQQFFTGLAEFIGIILTFIGQFIYGAVSYLITCLLYPGITKDPDDK